MATSKTTQTDWTTRFAGRRGLTRRAVLGGALGMVALPLLSACSQPTPTPTTAPSPAPPTAAVSPTAAASPTTAAGASPTAAAGASPTAAPASQTPASQIGGTVNVLATWSGEEQESFLAMVQPFEQATGVKVEYESTRDLNQVLTTRIAGGNPPDVAGLPGPGQMAEFAQAGNLLDLSSVLDTATLTSQYSSAWLQLGQVAGTQVGVFIKASLKGLIWYNAKAFADAGYQVPTTWDELMQLSQQIADSGTTPWSIALESDAASGWPGTDWLEDIILRQSGPDVYDQWYQGQIKWSSPEIKQAWETWGEIVGDPKMVYGGSQGMLATAFQEGANPLFTSPPNAYLHHQASFMSGFIVENNPGLQPVQDFNIFPFPDINPEHAGAVEAAGDLFGVFKDTPQSRALIQHLVTPEAQAIWVARGGAISPNKEVSLDDYPDELSKQMAETLTTAQIVRFDASDLMPQAMNDAFWKGILDFVSDTSNLDTILAELDRVQGESYNA